MLGEIIQFTVHIIYDFKHSCYLLILEIKLSFNFSISGEDIGSSKSLNI